MNTSDQIKQRVKDQLDALMRGRYRYQAAAEAEDAEFTARQELYAALLSGDPAQINAANWKYLHAAHHLITLEIPDPPQKIQVVANT